MGTPNPGKEMWNNKNVYGGPLHIFSTKPPTGHYRDGFCRTGADDPGNHSVAATLTAEFLSFTGSKGNSLANRNLEPGTKWCLCASRWKEAMLAAKSADDPVVPKVHLHATAKEALDDVDLKSLKKFALDAETAGAVGGTSPRGMASTPVQSANTTGGSVRDAHPDVGDDPEKEAFNKTKGRTGAN